MARPFARDDRYRIAAGIAAGLITAVLVIAFWVMWGGDPFAPGDLRVVAESDTAPPAPFEEERDAITPRPVGAVVGVREQRVLDRLERLAPPAPRAIAAFDIRASDVVWRDPDGVVWARAAAFTARVDARAAQRRDIVVSSATLTRARLDLRQDAAGRWNYENVFAAILEAEPVPGAPTRLFTMRNVRIVDGHADVRTPTQTFAITNAGALLGAVNVSDHQRRDPSVVVDTFAGTLDLPEFDRRMALTADGGVIRFADVGILFDVRTATVDGIQLAELTGELSERIPGWGVRVAGRALSVDLAALDDYLPEGVPVAGRASFAFLFEPLTETRTSIALSDIVAEAEGSRVLGSATVWWEPEQFTLRAAALELDPLALALIERFTGPLPYGGTLRGSVTGAEGDISFDLVAALTAPGLSAPFTTALTGRALMTPDGIALQRLVADFEAVPLYALQPVAPGLPLRGNVTGRVSLTGMPDASPLALDVRLQLDAGVVTLAGTLDVTGDTPTYDLSGRLIGVNLQTVLEADVPPAALTARFTAVGAGFDPETMVATITVDGTFTGWQTGPDDRVVADFSIRQGTFDVRTLSLQLATLQLDADGSWRVIEPMSGAVAYRAVITDMRPFGPYIPLLGADVAAGAVTAEGTFSGTLARMRVDGGFAASALRLGDWHAERIEATYRGQFGDPVPELVFDATATALVTPTVGTFENAVARVRMQPPQFVAEIDAARADGTVVQLFAEGQVPFVGPREVLVQRVQFDIDEQRWALVAPAVIRWGDDVDGVAVENFEMADLEGPGRVLVDGRVFPLDRVDARIRTVALPVGQLQQLFGRPQIVTGLLYATADIAGPGDAPVINAEFRLDAGSVEGVEISRLEGAVRYATGLLEANATAVLAGAGTILVEGAVPVAITFVGTPDFTLLDGAPVTGRAVADSLDIGPLAALSPFVRDAAGIVHGSFDVSGTVGDPIFAGRVQLTGGEAVLPDIDRRYTEGFADVELVGGQVIVRELRARSDGWLTASGALTFERLDAPVLDLTANFDGFRAVGARERRAAAVTGRANIAGPLDGPVLTGRLRFDDGTIRFPDVGPAVPDDDLYFSDPLPFGDPGFLPAPAPPAWYDALVIDALTVVAGDNLWIEGYDARVQLTGELTIDRVGTDLRIFGTLEGSRGQYVLAAGPIVRRFDIVSAQVRFLGTGDLNPAIDITARRRVIDPGGRNLEIDVRVAGTAQNPTLSLASADAVQMPQSELLSFLIFGQPSFALGGGVIPGEALLEQTFVGGLAEIASLELEQAIVQDLGLPVDVFQIHWGTGRFGGFGTPTIFLGRELTPDLYLTVETGLAALFADTEGGTETWAIRLEWAIDNRTTLRGGFEPVRSGQLLRGLRFALPATRPQQQFSLELRRRWYY